MSSPKILLFDEPLASLDEERKLEILPLIEHLRDEFRIPIVYVSHAVDEVARLANRVVVMDNGRVIATGPVEDVFGPNRIQIGDNRFARSSFITGRIVGRRRQIRPDRDLPSGRHGVACRPGRAVGGEARVVIKATDVTLSTTRPRNLSVRTILSGTVSNIETNDGPLAAVDVELQGHGRLVALATRMAIDELGLGPGDQVFALIKTVALDERTVAVVQS